jgi:hypothetical protein
LAGGAIVQGLIAALLTKAIAIVKGAAVNVERQKRLFDAYRGFFDQNVSQSDRKVM